MAETNIQIPINPGNNPTISPILAGHWGLSRRDKLTIANAGASMLTMNPYPMPAIAPNEAISSVWDAMSRVATIAVGIAPSKATSESVPKIALLILVDGWLIFRYYWLGGVRCRTECRLDVEPPAPTTAPPRFSKSSSQGSDFLLVSC